MYINAPSLRLPPFCKSTVLKFSGILPIDLNPRAENNTTPPVRVDGTAPREISFVIRFLSVLMFTNLKAVMPYMFWLQWFIFTKWNLQTTPKLAIIHIHKGNLQTTPKLEIWLSTRIPMSLATRILSSWSVSFKNKCIYIYKYMRIYIYLHTCVSQFFTHIHLDLKKKNYWGRWIRITPSPRGQSMDLWIRTFCSWKWHAKPVAFKLCSDWPGRGIQENPLD